MFRAKHSRRIKHQIISQTIGGLKNPKEIQFHRRKVSKWKEGRRRSHGITFLRAREKKEELDQRMPIPRIRRREATITLRREVLTLKDRVKETAQANKMRSQQKYRRNPDRTRSIRRKKAGRGRKQIQAGAQALMILMKRPVVILPQGQDVRPRLRIRRRT